MPRIIDTLDHAVGRTPDFVDTGVDYLRQVPPPDKLVGEDGTYNAGWFTHWDGQINLEASSAFDMALHRFFHLTLDAGRHYLVWNIADFGRAGNTALLIADKEGGTFEHKSLAYPLVRNRITASPDYRLFEDPASGSFIRISPDDRHFAFSIHAESLHLSGEGEHALGPPFVQCTRFHRGRGSLQWYGNYRLTHGTLVMGKQVIALPPGSLGTYDRTLGHQRGLQNWNWIAASGMARCVQTGERAELGLQLHIDRDGAKPRVDSLKQMAWIDGKLYKLPKVSFRYELLDDDHTSGPWKIGTPGQSDHGWGWVDLTLTPRFHRREERHQVIIDADFNQYYGELSGKVAIAGRVWELERFFACAEDSRLQL